MVRKSNEEYEVSNKILTIPNLLSFIRLCMIPAFLILLLGGNDIVATLVFAIAASTDWVDGQVARRTNSVSKLGQLLDPFVDRMLLICAVIGLLLVGRLPLWVIVFVLVRDGFLIAGGVYLLKRWNVRVAVIYLGKFATTFLYIGFGGLLLNWPLVAGMGWAPFAWLPGFNADVCSWGIWLVYLGLFLSIFSTSYYILKGWHGMKKAQAQETLVAASVSGGR